MSIRACPSGSRPPGHIDRALTWRSMCPAVSTDVDIWPAGGKRSGFSHTAAGVGAFVPHVADTPARRSVQDFSCFGNLSAFKTKIRAAHRCVGSLHNKSIKNNLKVFHFLFSLILFPPRRKWFTYTCLVIMFVNGLLLTHLPKSMFFQMKKSPVALQQWSTHVRTWLLLLRHSLLAPFGLSRWSSQQITGSVCTSMRWLISVLPFLYYSPPPIFSFHASFFLF